MESPEDLTLPCCLNPFPVFFPLFLSPALEGVVTQYFRLRESEAGIGAAFPSLTFLFLLFPPNTFLHQNHSDSNASLTSVFRDASTPPPFTYPFLSLSHRPPSFFFDRIVWLSYERSWISPKSLPFSFSSRTKLVKLRRQTTTPA